jgi:hypothetical protein
MVGTGIPIAKADSESLGGANDSVFGTPVFPGSGCGRRVVRRESEEGPCAAKAAIPAFVPARGARSLGACDPGVLGGLGEDDRLSLFLNFLN